ncbi:MAG: M23 family metallopeptidase [Parvibaculum sp.]|uniref:M23 family metallopeptidase n=1 Tax=Parvibaculum sp. TaxID=2024848 RepID=UPI0025D14498|nr:M23 family metallopeptidase [Parvibaculum sp.]MCE9648429.1 M23 family metallopeptidase [Parvibaculum sp.]
MNIFRRSILAFAIGLTAASALQFLDYAEAFDNAGRLAAAPPEMNLGDCLRGENPKTWPAAYRAICAEIAPPAPLAARPAGRLMPAENATPQPDCIIDEKGATKLTHDQKRQILPPRRAGRHAVADASAGVALRVEPACMVTSPASGTVLYAGEFKGYLGVVILGLADGRRLTVAGLGKVGVRRGETLRRGQNIGLTSRADAPALSAAYRGDGQAGSLLYFDLRNAEGGGEPVFWLARAD